MNKFILSFVVIVSFILDSLYQRSKSPASLPIAARAPSVNATSTPTQTPTPTNVPPTPTSSPPPSNTIQSATATPVQNTPTPLPSPTPTPTSGYKDGTYTGNAADAFYGMIQVQATISGGKIANIQFLQYPSDRGTSIAINQQADPMLAQEAIQAQSASVNIVSGATDSSQAFIQSLQSALSQAKM